MTWPTVRTLGGRRSGLRTVLLLAALGGAAAAVLTANKPGASTAVVTWWTVKVNGTDYVIPLYSPS